jgi:hypothetical protein
MSEESYSTTNEHSALLRLEDRRGEHHVFPYASLVYARMVTKKNDEDILELVFASHKATIRGYRLFEVLEGIRKCTCGVIKEQHNPEAAFGSEKDPPAILNIKVGNAWDQGKE